MNEVISADNTELLAQILGDVQSRTYINVVRGVQDQLLQSPDVIDVPVQHHFAPGVYMRQMDAAAGTLVVSKMSSYRAHEYSGQRLADWPQRTAFN